MTQGWSAPARHGFPCGMTFDPATLVADPVLQRRSSTLAPQTMRRHPPDSSSHGASCSWQRRYVRLPAGTVIRRRHLGAGHESPRCGTRRSPTTLPKRISPAMRRPRSTGRPPGL